MSGAPLDFSFGAPRYDMDAGVSPVVRNRSGPRDFAAKVPHQPGGAISAPETNQYRNIYQNIGNALSVFSGDEKARAQHAGDIAETLDRADDWLPVSPTGLETALVHAYDQLTGGPEASLEDYVNLGGPAVGEALNLGARGLWRYAAPRVAARAARNFEGTGVRSAYDWLREAPAPLIDDGIIEGASREAPNALIHPGSAYTSHEDGPFLIVKRQGAQPQIIPEARGASLPQLRDILADPANNQPLRIADAYTQEHFGRPYTPGLDPGTSLAKQSGIGRAYQMGVEGTPEYKHAIFERYGQMYPEQVERSGAQNYDQLTEHAYHQLGSETDRQFQTLPVEMRYHYGVGEYPTPSAMMGDVLGEGRLNVFRGGDPHPYLSDVDPDTGLTPNEKFRAVHDYFGHVLPGATFRAGGEEVAFGSHAQMMSPMARAALASETRGQNSLVNYSPLNAELTYEMQKIRDQIAEEQLAKKRGASWAMRPETIQPLNAKLRELGAQTQFAPQVPLLLPPEMIDPAFQGGMPDYLQALSKPRFASPDMRGVHLSTTPGLSQTDPAFYGTGHRGDDYLSGTGGNGRGGGQTSFYIGPPGTVQPEPWVADIAKQAYEAQLKGLYNVNEDPEQLVKLARAYHLKDERFDKPTAYVPDLARMLHEYGYNGYYNPSFFGNEGAANVFDKMDVTPIEKGPKGYAEGGAVSVPVPGAVALPVPA